LRVRPERAIHELARGPEALVEVDRADERFVGTFEVALPLAAPGLLLPASEPEPRTKVEHLHAHARERGAADQGRAPLGQAPLLHLREPRVQLLRHHRTEYRVTEELEPLVGRGWIL